MCTALLSERDTFVTEVEMCVQVKIYLPVEVMLKMEKRLLQQSGESSGLMLHLTSDFHKAQVPLQVSSSSKSLKEGLLIRRI